MKTFVIKCFFVLLSLLPICMTAQTKWVLSGKITDTNGEPLPSVTIAVENTTTGTHSDLDGQYSLRISPGKKTIIVSCLGYRTVKRNFDLQQNIVFDFILEESSVALGTVDVYGKTQTQKVKESAYAANALNVKMQANTLHNINTIVNRTTGVRIREEGGVGSDFELSINGMSGNSVRYFIDGIPLSSKGSGVNLGNLPVNLIDRVEIFKGVVPAYLGADALGGAVNIITKADKKNYLDASYSIGSFHTHKFDFNAQYVEKKSGLMIKPVIGINYSKNDYTMKEVEIWDKESSQYVIDSRKRFHDNYFSFLGQLEAGFTNKSWADLFFVSVSYSKVNKDLQTGSIQSVVYGEAARQSDAWNISARYRKQDFLLKNLRLSLSLSHTWDHSLTVDTAFRKYDWNGNFIETSRNEITGRGRSLRHYKRPLTIVHGNLDYRFNEHHTLNLNYLGNRTGNNRSDEMDAEFVPSNDILGNHTFGLSYNQSFFEGKMNNSFFIKDYISYLKVEQQDLYWITGSNQVPSSSTKNYSGYGVALRYAIWEELAAKFSYEHSVRLPLARELLGNGTTVMANVRLNPESSNNYNLGLFGTAKWQGGHMLNYEMNGFIRDADDYIRAVLSERDGLMQYENVSSVKIKGVEGEVSYRYANRLRAAVNCSYQDARDMKKYKDDGKPSITYNNKLPNRPWLFSNAELDFFFHKICTKDDRLHVGYQYQYVHWFYLTWEAYGALDGKSKIPTQHQHRIVASYSWRNERYNVSLECNNLFDKGQYDNFMLQKPGRSFLCKFRLFIH